MEPAGERPLFAYLSNASEMKARRLDWPEDDKSREKVEPGVPTFFRPLVIDGKFLSKKPYWDCPSLRESTPNARFGNLLIFRDPYKCTALAAPGLFFGALPKIYAKKPDSEEAEQLLKQSIALDPTPFFVHLELGNVYLKRGWRDEALKAYSEASRYASYDLEQRGLIEAQIKRVSSEPLDQIPELRNPGME
jgi:tetratricopeptide (TPR) repeat protein